MTLLFCGLCTLAAAGLTLVSSLSYRYETRIRDGDVTTGPSLSDGIRLFYWEPDEFRKHIPEDKIGGDAFSTSPRGIGPAVSPRISANVCDWRFIVCVDERRYWRDRALESPPNFLRTSGRQMVLDLQYACIEGSGALGRDHIWYDVCCYYFLIPVWCLIVVFLLPPIFFLTRCLIRLRRRPDTACTTCHYDLTGNVSGICPECGRAIVRSQVVK